MKIKKSEHIYSKDDIVYDDTDSNMLTLAVGVNNKEVINLITGSFGEAWVSIGTWKGRNRGVMAYIWSFPKEDFEKLKTQIENL